MDEPERRTKPKTRKRKIPSSDPSKCRSVDPEEAMRFSLGIEGTDWKVRDIRIGMEDGISVEHYVLEFGGKPDDCPCCGRRMKLYDHRERIWRHTARHEFVTYIHADVPRFVCEHCRKVSQMEVPWADPGVSYTRAFMDSAIAHMSRMSITAAADELITTWTVLDGIVGRTVKRYLDRLDLSGVRRIRIDETSAKKRHRYITVVTDADTDDIIFITKGKGSDAVEEFAKWLTAHNGDPASIGLVASDFGEAFISGTRTYLPNAESVVDPFHLVQLGNQKMDSDRRASQAKESRLKDLRFRFLKNPMSLTPAQRSEVKDIARDHEELALSYRMNMSLRFGLKLRNPELARQHFEKWIAWVTEKGSRPFRTLAKTVEKHIDAIVRAIETGINNGYQESLNGRIQMTKRIANGYHDEMRLGRMAFFRHGACRTRERRIWIA